MGAHKKMYDFANGRFLKSLPTGETVTQFLAAFGSPKELVSLLTFANVPVNHSSIRTWRQYDHVPEKVFQVLSRMRDEGMVQPVGMDVTSSDEIGAVEVRFKGTYFGRFELARGMEVRLIKRKST